MNETRPATALHNLGMAAYDRHDYPAALAFLKQCLDMCIRLEERQGIVYALTI